MKQKRKVKSQNFTEKGANKILASWLILLGGILCFGAASLFMTPKVLGQLTVLSYTGIESKNEVVYHMDFVAPKDQTIVVNEMFMKENNGERNFYMSGGSVVLAEYNMSEESLKGINNVGTGKYANILGGESNNVDSSNVTIIAGERNNVSEGNDNATVMGLVSGSVSVGNGGVPLVLVGGSNNKIGNNQNGTVIVGGDSNNIGHEVTSSWILGGENNNVMANNAIVAGSNVLANNAGASDIFVFSDKNGLDTNGGFMPKSPNSFYLDVENGVGLNTPAGNNGGLASKGAISIGDLNEGACTTENVGMQGVLSGCLVGCTKDGLELLDTSEGCLKKFGKEPPIPDEPDPQLGSCFVGNVDISHASRCGNPAGYANTVFQVKLIDAKTNPDGSSSSITCPSGDNQCVYQCDDGYHLVGDKCYKDCGLDGKKIKHGDSGIWYDQSSVECGDGKTCSSHGRSLSCNDGDLYYNGVKVDNSNPYKHASCQLTNHNVNRNLYPLTEAEIDRTRGNYVPDTGYTANNAQDKCEPGTVYYYLDDCYTNYTKVGGRDGKCYEKCSYTGNHDVDHGIRKGFYENETECRSNDKNGQCTGVIMKSCNDGTWTPGGGHVSCSLTEVSCNPDEPDVENIDGQCSTTEIYKCVKGEAVDKNYNNNVWTWKCKGSGAGTTGDCEIIPETSYSCIGTYPAGATPSSQTPVANMNWYCALNTNNACSYTCQKGQECNGTSGCKDAVYKCNPGTYLKKGDTKCTQCPCGSYCTGGNFTYNTSKDQGINACGGGKYSEAGASSCLKISCGYYGSGACSATPNKCEDGTYSEEGSSQCSTCTSGQPDANQCACVGGKNCTGTAPGNNTKKSSATPTSSTGWKYVSNTDAELKACEWTCADSNFERNGNTTNCSGKILQCGGSEPPSQNVITSESEYTFEGEIKNWRYNPPVYTNIGYPCEWECKPGRTGPDCSTPDTLIPGECGSADGKTISAPSLLSESDKCSKGGSSEVTPKTSTYDWTCTKDTAVNCSAYRDPTCGEANGKTYASAPSSNLCGIGEKSKGVTENTSTYDWTCSNGSKSVDCSANKSGGGSTEITCVAGKYLPANSTSCSTCPAGYYCQGGTFTKSNKDQGIEGCGGGKYSTAGSKVSTDCKSISCGYYGTNASSATPNQCGDNKWSTTGSSSCETCNSGYTSSSNHCTCVVISTPDEKITCVAGKYLPANSTSCSDCEAGYYCPGGTFTKSNKDQGKNGCPCGSYCEAKSSEAKACGDGKWSEAGASSCSDISCGYYGSSECSAKPSGKQCASDKYSEAGASSCTSCPAGQKPNSTQCVCESGPIKCEAGTYLPANSTSCSDCEEGNYCPGGTYNFNASKDQGKNGCPGSMTSAKKSSKITECRITCSANPGYYLPAGGSSCTLCPSGYYCGNGGKTYYYNESNDQGLTSCPNGYPNSERGSQANTACYKKFTATFDKNGATSLTYYSSTCKIAYPNSSCDITLPPASRTNGTIVGWNKDGSTRSSYGRESKVTLTSDETFYVVSYISCEAGKYLKTAGGTYCASCAAGTYKTSHSVYNNDTSSCNNCACGTYSNAGASSCTSCGEGTYSNAGASSCTSCPSGKKSSSDKCGCEWCTQLKKGEFNPVWAPEFEGAPGEGEQYDRKCYDDAPSQLGEGGWEYCDYQNESRYPGGLRPMCVCSKFVEVSCGSSGNGGGNTGGGGTCFLAGTQVHMADGTTKNIEDIEIGEMVLTYNIETKQNEYNRVLKKYVHEDVDEKLYELTINGKVLKVTEAHRFYVVMDEDNGYQCPYNWVVVGKLKVGDVLLMKDGSYVTIDQINYYSNYGTFYNLLVDINHNYYVAEGYLVHNLMGDTLLAKLQNVTQDLKMRPV